MSSINSVSSTTNPYQTNSQSPWQQISQDFKTLQSALQSGDLGGAQQAFASLQQSQQNSSQPGTSGTGGSAGQNSPTANAFQALQSALSTGNLSAAQQAFATMQQNMQSAGARKTGHHHHAGGSSGNTTQTTSPTSSDTATPMVTSLLDVQA